MIYSAKRWVADRAAKVDMGDPSRLVWLFASWYEDLAANKGDWSGAGFHILALYRFGVWAQHQDAVGGKIAGIVYKMCRRLVANLYGSELPRSASIGRRLRLPHGAGVVVSYKATVGDDCIIRQNVTIGQFDRGRKRLPPYAPTLGNGVEVGAGAVIVGGINIGDRARIGPNAVVMANVPAGASAIAGSAEVMAPLTQDRNEA